MDCTPALVVGYRATRHSLFARIRNIANRSFDQEKDLTTIYDAITISRLTIADVLLVASVFKTISNILLFRK